MDCSEFIWGKYTEIVVSYLYKGETAWLLLRSPGIELFWVSRAICSSGSCKGCFSVKLGETLFYNPLFWLSRRQRSSSEYESSTWKMALKVVNYGTQEDSALPVHSSGLPGDRAHIGNTILLPEIWSWKCHWSVTLGKTLLCIFLVQVSQDTDLIQLKW